MSPTAMLRRPQPQRTLVTRPRASTSRLRRAPLNSIVTAWPGLSARTVPAAARVRAAASSCGDRGCPTAKRAPSALHWSTGAAAAAGPVAGAAGAGEGAGAAQAANSKALATRDRSDRIFKECSRKPANINKFKKCDLMYPPATPKWRVDTTDALGRAHGWPAWPRCRPAEPAPPPGPGWGHGRVRWSPGAP